MTERVAPQDVDAERSVLGALMLDSTGEAFDVAISLLSEQDFYYEAHGVVFRAIVSVCLRREPVDILSLRNELRGMGQLDAIGGTSYLTLLGESVPTTANLPHYARIVREKAALRRLIETAAKIAGSAYAAHEGTEGPSVRAVAELAEREIMAAAGALTTVADDPTLPPSERKEPVEIWTLFDDEERAMAERAEAGDGLLGPSTGFPAIDRLTQGCVPGELHMTGARPSMGKTALETCIGVHLAVHGGNVLYFSLEMPRIALLHRVWSLASAVPLRFIRAGCVILEDQRTRPFNSDERERLAEAKQRLRGKHFVVDDTRSITPAAMEARARREIRRLGHLDAIIVDHAVLVTPDQTTRKLTTENDVMTSISNGLQAMSRRLTVNVRALMQLNRGVERREDKRPALSDLRGSGAWEQDADIVAFLYRPSYYDKRDVADKGQRGPDDITRSEAEYLVEKSRNGETAFCKLQFAEEITRFENMAKSWDDAPPEQRKDYGYADNGYFRRD